MTETEFLFIASQFMMVQSSIFLAAALCTPLPLVRVTCLAAAMGYWAMALGWI
jgi:hypothetical protein